MSVRRATSIRVAYVGPNMDLAKAAYLAIHVELNHEVEYFANPDHVPRAPAPDVVVIAPLTICNGRVEGPCLMCRMMPPSTLIVALTTAQGHSHKMFVKHALGGRCHARSLVHHPRPGFTARHFVERLDQVARTEGEIADSMCGIPEFLDLRGVDLDLGQVMEDNYLADFLFVAATNRDWSRWSDLAALLNYGEGTVKNRMSKFGKIAAEAGLIPPKADPDEKFRIGEFVRYVTEHRSFIRAYAQHRRDFISISGDGSDSDDTKSEILRSKGKAA